MRNVSTAGLLELRLAARPRPILAATIAFLGAALMFSIVPPALAVDSDGDGVDDATDCRPSDPSTWASSPEARNLTLTGGTNTSFSWLAPLPAPSTPEARVYDILRKSGPSVWGSAVCLLSNTSNTSAPFLDASIPFSGIYFYLVRSKTVCGGALGENSSGVPTMGPGCSLANGQTCAASAACTSGNCCGAACSDVQTDVQNCGNCGHICSFANAAPTCTSGSCSFSSCNVPFLNCDGLQPNGCETNSNTDVQNCGGCNHVCSSANATPFCTSGSCGFNCNAPFLNCDGLAGNGCEVNASNDVQNCNACNNICPGYLQPFDNVTCQSSACTFSCQGEHYDVNNNASNGCEETDTPTGNHTLATATNLGSHDCTDSTISFNGILLSDARAHATPAVTGFDATTGSAPDYSAISATGGPFCVNDFNFTLTTSGGGATSCYRLSVITNLMTKTCTTTGLGNCNVSNGSGGYSDGTTISFKVEKTCSTTVRERVTYTVSGHI